MTASAERAYGELLRERRPHAIRSDEDYKRTMRELGDLAIRGESGKLSPAESEYFSVLSALVGNYERITGADKWPPSDPVDFLKEVMDQSGITQAQVAKALGDRAITSSILSGRRKISKANAKKLSALFKVDAGHFI